MAIDHNIITRGMNRVELEPRSNALARMLKVQDMQQSGEMNALALDEKRRGMADEDQMRELTRQAGGDVNKLRDLTYGAGNYKQGAVLDKTLADRKTTELANRKATLEQTLKTFEAMGQIMSGVKDPASYEAARQQAAQLLGPEAAANLPAQYDPVLIEQKRLQAMSVKDQAEQEHKRLTLAETSTHHRNAEKLTAQGHAVTMRGQDKVDARSRELNANGKEIAAAAKKEAATDKDVTKFSNTLQKEGIPELETAVSGAEGAMGRYKKGEVPGIGAVKNALPAFMMSDEGKDVRQALAQVRNIVLSARSGAAVTDQELRRLVEEIGTGAGMTEDDIRKGLTKIRTRIDSIKTNAAAGVNDEVLKTYKDRGGIAINRGNAEAPTAPPKGPAAGTVQDGYRFKGGNPADPKSWEKV